MVPAPRHTAFIAVGSNLGDRSVYLLSAKKLLSEVRGVYSLRSSPIYETEPSGGPPQGKYLNAVWKIETSLSHIDLFNEMKKIERDLGRDRKERNGPRTIDLDLLFYDDLVCESAELTLPHPRMRGRWFVLKPAWDLAADWIHPVFKKSICELLDECHETH